MNKINKLILPATILVASLVLGGFFYAIQISKQKSIERQQETKFQEDRRIEETKSEQVKKEYVAKRKNECYSIYEKERNEWSNVKDSTYNVERDVCVVKYESNKPKNTDAECEKLTQNTSDTSTNLRSRYFENYSDCLENRVSKDF